jgi:hypothetical protein
MSDQHDDTTNTPDEQDEGDQARSQQARSQQAHSEQADETVEHGELWVPGASASDDGRPAEAPATSPAVSPPRWSGRKTAIAAALAIGVAGVGAVGAAALPSGPGDDSAQVPGSRPGTQLPGGAQAPGYGEGLNGQGPLGQHDHDHHPDGALPPRPQGGDRWGDDDGDGPLGRSYPDGQDAPPDQHGLPDDGAPTSPSGSTLGTDTVT